MSAVRQIGIKMVVDAQSVTTELPRASREFANMGSSAEQASTRATRSLAQVQLSVRDIVAGAAGLHVVSSAIQAITNAITALPRNAFDFSKQLEVSQVGMAGILGSMTAIDGKQTDYNTALRISSDMIRKLNDDALRTAATSQELTTVFQALLAPGLSARMTLDEIRQLTVVGTNAVKSMGLESTQVVQELRDLVAGGITAASSTLATALQLKDSDITKAKASSEGLFAFLMERLKGFKASSDAFGDTFTGKLDQLREGATRVAADGLGPLIAASKQAVGEVSKLFTTIDDAGEIKLNQALVDGIKEYATTAAQAMAVGQEWVGVLWENRDAAIALGSVWAGIKLGGMVVDTRAAVAAQIELVQTSRLAAAQSAAEAAGNVEVAATSRQKVAAYLAELAAKAASAQAEVSAQTAQLATLTITREAITLSRAEVVAKLEATRVTMAQAEAQIVAARAAGAQSIALALVREGTEALTAAQARHALLLNELAVLGKQQASVNAAVAAATAAQSAATTAATAAAGGLAAAQGAASIAGRALAGVWGFLGGPIGFVTTALTIGVTAWQLWGSAGSKAERTVQNEVARSTADIVADLDKQIAKLGARNALAAAGMGELAKKGGEAAERMAALQGQINNLQSGKGLDGGAPLPEVARVDLLQKLLVQYGTLAGTVQRAEEAQTKLDKGAGNLTLTAANAEQAFRKTIDGAKTATAAQVEFKQKVDASRLALEALKKTNAAPEVVKSAEKDLTESEQAWAAERDRKIKEMGAGSATAHSQALSAQIEAIKQGYKKIAAQTADGLDEIDSLRKQDLISEYAAVERRTALKLKDIDAQESALQRELQLARGKKDSATEQARLAGQLDELAQKRANISNQGARDLDELFAKPLIEATNANVKAASSVKDLAEQQEAANAVFGKSKTAIEQMTLAQLQNQLAEAEGSDRFTPEYIASLNAKIAAQKLYVDALNGADFKTLMSKEQEWLDQAKERASLYEDEAKLAGLTNVQRAKIVATRQIELKLAKELAEINKSGLSDTEKDALRIKAKEAAAIDSSAAVNKVIQDDAAKSAEQIQQSLTDAIMRGGKSGADYLKDLFRTMVLRPIISAVMAPISGVINGVVNAGLNAVGLGSGGAGGVLSAASSLSNVSSTISGIGNTLSGIGSTVSTTMTGLSTGATSLGSILTATGAQVATAATYGTAIGSAQTAMLAAQTAGMGTGAAGAGTAALGAIPVYGWIALAAVAAFAAFSGKGDSRFGSQGSYTPGKGTESNGGPNGANDDFGGVSAGNKSTAETIDKILGKVGSKDRLSYFAGGFESSENDKGFSYAGGILSNGKVFGQGTDGQGYMNARGSMNAEEAQVRYVNELKQATLQALQSATDIPKAISSKLDGVDVEALDQKALDVLVGVIDKIIVETDTFASAVKDLPIDNLKNMSFDATAALIETAGGLQKLTEGTAFVYQTLYSESERAAVVTGQLAKGFADIGLAVPESDAALRQLIVSQDLSTESGRNMVVALGALAPAFDSVANAARASAQQMMGIMANYASEGEQRAFAIEQIRKGLADGGINVSAGQIGSASRDQAWQLYKDQLAAGNLQQADAIKNQLDAFAKITQASGSMMGSSGSSGSGSSGSAGAQIRNEWQSICDSLVDEIKRVRGELAGTGKEGLAYAQAQYAIANAQARAGDADAAKALPQLNRTLLDLAEGNASSSLELRRMQAQQAASLQATHAILAAKYGVKIPAFASGGDHLGGLRLVGERGPELESTGASRIWNAEQTSALLGGRSGGDSAETAALMRDMCRLLGKLVDVASLDRGYSKEIESLLTRVTEKGNAMRSKAVTA